MGKSLSSGSFQSCTLVLIPLKQLLFETKREEAKTLKAQKDEYKKEKKEAEKAVKPIQEKHAKVQGEVAQIASRTGALDKKVKESRKQFDDCIKKSQKFQDAIDEEMSILNTIDTQQRVAQKDVDKQRRRLEEIKAEAEDLPPMDEIETAFGEAQVDIRKIKSKIDELRRKSANLNGKIDEEHEKKKDAENRLSRVKDEKQTRLNLLYGANKHAKAIYDFVDNNRKMFRRPVWGPVGKSLRLLIRFSFIINIFLTCAFTNFFSSSR